MSNTTPKKSDDMKRSSEESKSIGILFRYADSVDWLLMLLGTIGDIGDGMSTNCMLIFASRITSGLGFGQSKQINNGNFMDEVEKCSLYFVYLGLAVMVVAFMVAALLLWVRKVVISV